jgi:hypothetical protein
MVEVRTHGREPGISVNAWLVRAVVSTFDAAHPGRHRGDRPGRRITGYACG